MNHLLRISALFWILIAGVASAGPAEAENVKTSLKSAMEKWSLQMRAATTPEARAKAASE